MSTDGGPRTPEVLPTGAWDMLNSDTGAVLVDVRTEAEWKFVGVPDLSALGQSTIFVEWQCWPDMSPNPRFVADLTKELGDRDVSSLLFLCRSGVRSLRAAETVKAAFLAAGRDVGCINVTAGFEGDLCAQGHRGGLAGWKAAGLPWRQS